MTEIWKDIVGYENYQISNLGNVKNKTLDIILKPRTEKDGYLRVNLRSAGKMKDGRIHRLVATHFIPNTENKKTVNHKNRNIKDNSVANLEWLTHREQMLHYHKTKNTLRIIWKYQKKVVTS